MSEDIKTGFDEGVAAVEVPSAIILESGPLTVGPVRIESKKPSFTYLVGTLAGGNLVSTVLRVIGGLLQARCAAPAILGTFSGIGNWLNLTRFAQLGVLNGLNRELPYYFGKGDHDRVAALAAQAQACAIAIGGSIAAGMLAVAVWYAMHGNGIMAAGWASNAVQAFVFFYATMYLASTYRTTHDFAKYSLANVVQNALAVVLVLFVYFFQFYGLCLRSILLAIVGMSILHYWRPMRVVPAWNFGDFIHLLKIGFPIFAVGELPMLQTFLEGRIVFTVLGAKEMGFYTTAIMVGSAMETLPTAVSQVIYPRMAECYGRTQAVGEVMLMTAKPMLLNFAAMVPVAALGWGLARPMTTLLLPNYIGAVPAMQWALLPPILSTFFPILNIFNVVRRQDLDIVGTLAGMLGYFVALAYFFNFSLGVEHVLQSMLIGRGVQLISCYLLLVPLIVRSKTLSPEVGS
jgi:O-antigen/teichoic acid export membrane protein